MFDSAFYLINQHFDSNLTNYTSFAPNLDYLLRFVVDGWEVAEPNGVQAKDAARALAKVLATTGDLSLYEIKGITFSKVPMGEKVGYYSPSWYTISWGNGYTDTLTAADGTWVMDVVFRPKTAEKSWTAVEKWTQILSGELTGSRGTPQVHCAGLITFDVTSQMDDENVYAAFLNAATFWNGRHAFWEVYPVSSEKSPTGQVGDLRQVNKVPPLRGWNAFPPYVGQDGLGIALGSALSPHLLSAKAVEATTQPIDPNDPTGPVVDPGNAFPTPAAATITWRNLSTFEKVGAAVFGAALVTAGGFVWQALDRR